MKRKYVGLSITVIAFLFCIAETVWFGGNWLPASKAEVICDQISLISCAIGLFIMNSGANHA